jgi:hypothetical protein
MINKIEIIGCLILFMVIYLVLYADHKLHEKCECDNCYLSSNKVSIKIPLIVTVIGFVIYRTTEPYINSYINGNSIVKQNIITEMADF